jgi:membrane-associated protease RseP (regulator of RpoE activity)
VDEYITQHGPLAVPPAVEPPPRRKLLPLGLFVLTCLSTFFTGGAWSVLIDPHEYVYLYYFNADDGLRYMLSVMGILLAHEMGHFVQAVRHGVPASLPYFIPMPLTPIGTMGAVIGMQGSKADRRQLFDIGITGPLAGLIVALPLAWYGVATAVPLPPPTTPAVEATWVASDPWVFQMLMRHLHPDLPVDTVFAWNPYYMAAWVGMLITGLNMLPLSQLDGGHVSYALFGRWSHLLARGVVLAAITYMIRQEQYTWIMMLAVVFFIGIDHPPTSNDEVKLGWGRRLLGFASLAIPVLCLAPTPIRPLIPGTM